MMTVDSDWLKSKISSALISALCALGIIFVGFLCAYPNGWNTHYYVILGLGIIIGTLIRCLLPVNIFSFTSQGEPPKITNEALNTLLKPYQRQIPIYYYIGAYTGLSFAFWIITQLTMKAQLKNAIPMKEPLIIIASFGLSVSTYSVMFFAYLLRSWERISKQINH
jgi:MFS family permease